MVAGLAIRAWLSGAWSGLDSQSDGHEVGGVDEVSAGSEVYLLPETGKRF